MFLGFIYNPAVADSSTYDYLARGDSGDLVRELQAKLNKFGWYNLTEDGLYGPATEKAVMDFQKKLGLKVDGIYGEASKKALEEAIKQPAGTQVISVIVDGKQRELFGTVIDNQNYIRLVDIYHKLDVAEVGYSSAKKKPTIKTR